MLAKLQISWIDLGKSIRQFPSWDYFRYNVLPDELFHHRKTFERMAIRDFASIFDGPYAGLIKISDCKLTNDKIDQ